MELTPEPINVFVLGDLILDHAIFVGQKGDGSYQRVQDESAYSVHRRTNLAGGAANCARVLAAVSAGRTYLWGVGGRSPWGRFSEVLDQSHVYDAAPGRAVLRGIVDQHAKTNTITRLILEEPSRGAYASSSLRRLRRHSHYQNVCWSYR
jgi:bifunctional ADP-heptose synthase (sugar kinase/adenylyltransferase)